MIRSKGERGHLQYFAEAQRMISSSLMKKHRPLNSCNVCAEASPNPFHTLQVTPAAADPLQSVYCLGPHCLDFALGCILDVFKSVHWT